jgi:hypothetical protein
MASFLSINDPEFWKHYPEELKDLAGTPPEGITGLAYFLLGDRKDNPPTVVTLRMGPNWVLPRHAHDCHRFEVVVQGSLDVGDRTLKPGDVMISEPGLAYGPHIAGPEGCTTFEIFSNHRASYVTFVDTPEGRVECDMSTPEGLKKMEQVMQRDMEAQAQA